MISTLSNRVFGMSTADHQKTAKYLWYAVLFAAVILFASQAFATGGGTAMSDLNVWIEDELGGSVGLTVSLIAFFMGLIGAIATRQFMPLIWGIGIGLVIGIFLEIVVGAAGVGMPITVVASAVAL